MMLRKKLGLLLLVISFLPWLVILILPFTDLSLSEIAAASGGLFIFAEVTFVAAIALMGKEVWAHLKNIVKVVFENIKQSK